MNKIVKFVVVGFSAVNIVASNDWKIPLMNIEKAYAGTYCGYSARICPSHEFIWGCLDGYDGWFLRCGPPCQGC